MQSQNGLRREAAENVDAPPNHLPYRFAGSPSGEVGVVIRTDSCPVTTTTGAGSSITSTIGIWIGISSCGALGNAACNTRFSVATTFVVLFAARRTFGFAPLRAARFADFLSAGLARTLPRFKFFLRAATRFFALAMAVSYQVCCQLFWLTRPVSDVDTPLTDSPRDSRSYPRLADEDCLDETVSASVRPDVYVCHLASLPGMSLRAQASFSSNKRFTMTVE